MVPGTVPSNSSECPPIEGTDASTHTTSGSEFETSRSTTPALPTTTLLATTLHAQTTAASGNSAPPIQAGSSAIGHSLAMGIVIGFIITLACIYIAIASLICYVVHGEGIHVSAILTNAKQILAIMLTLYSYSQHTAHQPMKESIKVRT